MRPSIWALLLAFQTIFTAYASLAEPLISPYNDSSSHSRTEHPSAHPPILYRRSPTALWMPAWEGEENRNPAPNVETNRNTLKTLANGLSKFVSQISPGIMSIDAHLQDRARVNKEGSRILYLIDAYGKPASNLNRGAPRAIVGVQYQPRAWDPTSSKEIGTALKDGEFPASWTMSNWPDVGYYFHARLSAGYHTSAVACGSTWVVSYRALSSSFGSVGLKHNVRVKEEESINGRVRSENRRDLEGDQMVDEKTQGMNGKKESDVDMLSSEIGEESSEKGPRTTDSEHTFFDGRSIPKGARSPRLCRPGSWCGSADNF